VVAPRAQALILAAGKGTRLRSALPKALQPLQGLPLLEHVLRAAAGSGASPLTVVVGHGAPGVEEAFAGRGLRFVRQEPQRGTGHAVMAARAEVAAAAGAPLLVVNGDQPLLRAATLASLLEHHLSSGATATLLTAVLDAPGPYGRVLRRQDGFLHAVVEARDASPEVQEVREINAGAYVFDVDPLLRSLDRLRPDNDQQEYYLTDALGLLVAAGQRVAAWRCSDAAEALGVNTQAELSEAAQRLRVRKLESLLAAGVRIEDPATTHVDTDAEVEADAVLRPFTILEGRTRVGAGCAVGPYTRVVDSELAPGAQVLDHCLLRECAVEEGASVGPFAHLRPESRVGRRARVGNFVELKKTRLGEGSKAPHLSYVGDADVGPGVNIGAGTITCNYDGELKHPTRIEAGAFVGSNSTLVAPVTIGEGAYVAAGSTITADVPKEALALGRARQVLKPGWAKARAARRRT
jgi:bifunctional UDP-N-acetylglucosamine pyrophosphorylase / glucosamine-1-phosphate N-acetyltransferase